MSMLKKFCCLVGVGVARNFKDEEPDIKSWSPNDVFEGDPQFMRQLFGMSTVSFFCPATPRLIYLLHLPRLIYPVG